MTEPKTEPMSAARRLRNIVGGSAGNLVEWFDWYAYAAFTLYFAPVFFPSEDATAQLLSAAAVFAVGFLMRPIGAWIMGVYADRKGRKAGLTLSVTLMCTGSLIIEAKRVGADTLLSQIVDMVANAQRSRAPIQKLADAVAGQSQRALEIVLAAALRIEQHLLGSRQHDGALLGVGVVGVLVDVVAQHAGAVGRLDLGLVGARVEGQDLVVVDEDRAHAASIAWPRRCDHRGLPSDARARMLRA